MTEKLLEYKKRHIRWQNFTITQLGYTNNIIFTISIGFLAFAFDKDFLTTFSTSQESAFSWEMFFYLSTIFCLLLSIGFGIATSLSRLYDFRITRHIALTRQIYCEYCDNENCSLPDYDFPNPKFKELLGVYFKIIFRELKFLSIKETRKLRKQPDLIKKFNHLRRLSHTLGILSWIGMKKQLLFLFCSLLLYSISLFM
jgi:hypothetical protein